jgi:folate-dependent phosphoribosylglycinamide formyltransferase PurN
MSRGIVLITNDSPYGQRVLQAIYKRGILLDAVLISTGDFALPSGANLGLLKRGARWPRSVASALRRKLRFYSTRRSAYKLRSRLVVVTGDMNSARMLYDLHRLAPDFIIWGGGGILKPRTIEAARSGVFNAHPALLPWVRGCGVVGHSLQAGIPIGATLHYIDQGIDTGTIIERRLLRIRETDTTLLILEEAADDLAAEMMADVVVAIKEHGRAPSGVAQLVRHPLYRWPDEDVRRKHDALARSGRALELFKLWNPLCTDHNRLTLPVGAVDAVVAASRFDG